MSSSIANNHRNLIFMSWLWRKSLKITHQIMLLLLTNLKIVVIFSWWYNSLFVLGILVTELVFTMLLVCWSLTFLSCMLLKESKRRLWLYFSCIRLMVVLRRTNRHVLFMILFLERTVYSFSEFWHLYRSNRFLLSKVITLRKVRWQQ